MLYIYILCLIIYLFVIVYKYIISCQHVCNHAYHDTLRKCFAVATVFLLIRTPPKKGANCESTHIIY